MKIPEGWKLMPVEPTPEMIIAASESWDGRKQSRFQIAYGAMLRTAPTPPAQEDELRQAAEELEDAVRYLEGTEIEYPKAIRLTKALKKLRAVLERE
jgi:hypothetical protein